MTETDKSHTVGGVPMLSVSDLAERYGIARTAATRLMQTLRYVDISPPGSRYKTLRVPIDRKQNLQEVCGNICQGHERFRRELLRAQDLGGDGNHAGRRGLRHPLHPQAAL